LSRIPLVLHPEGILLLRSAMTLEHENRRSASMARNRIRYQTCGIARYITMIEPLANHLMRKLARTDVTERSVTEGRGRTCVAWLGSPRSQRWSSSARTLHER
jgi:hypothetical protein